MIGLIDLDIYHPQKFLLPNLEIMKLATYYQKEKKEYVRLIDPLENNLSGYDKIFLRSDNLNNPIPSHILQYSNIEYGGNAFSKGIYLPFEEEIIDFCLPTTSIYKPFLREKMIEGLKAKDINNFLDNTYFRISNGKEKLPIPPVRAKKKVFIYDDNLIQDGWEKVIETLTQRKPSSIVTLNPIRCFTINQFFKVRQYTKIARTNSIILDLPIPLDELNIFFKKYEKKLLAEITLHSEVFLPFGEKKDRPFGKLAYADNLYYTLNLIYSFWARKIPIKLKYELYSLPDTNPFHELFTLIENWSNISTENKRGQQLIDKIKSEKQKEEYDLFLKIYPKQKNLFLQNFTELSNRGFWRV
ncbi:MAG: hypothetical protein J6J11_01055 [Treponema sp.]|nr:hypothetical protein [Clostridia bacterium]MBP3606889.1 hypothetical protein [Treponema sp.]